MPKKAGGFERYTPFANTLPRFIERVGDKPEHAPGFAEESARNLADTLHDNYRVRRQRFIVRLSVRTGHKLGEGAPLRPWSKGESDGAAGVVECGSRGVMVLHPVQYSS